jgi:integrase
MATIRRRGATWQVQVRRQGHPTLSRTFRLKADAEQWARQKEAEIDRGELPVDTRLRRSHTLAQLLERYAVTVIPRKRGAHRERYMRVILRHPLSRLSLHRLTPAEIAKYRDERLAVVTSATVQRELAIVRHCLQVARNEWGFVLPSNPVDQVKLPPPNNPRERRASADELERLLDACEAKRLRRRAGVSGLRFHDLRHEAVSRFFEKGLNMPEVAAISGHRDPRMLMRYTHPKAEAIAAKL